MEQLIHESYLNYDQNPFSQFSQCVDTAKKLSSQNPVGSARLLYLYFYLLLFR
jgi:hypothetical protein